MQGNVWMRAAFLSITVAVTHPAVATSQLPNGFVRLSEIAPDILQDLRYASARNFTGRPVPGYHAPVCILARPVAEALKRVQADLVPRGLSLLIFDCYRPVRSVAAFMQWAQDPTHSNQTKQYYPRLAKIDLVRQGYIAQRSSHSKGIAVDLTIVRLSTNTPALRDALQSEPSPCTSVTTEAMQAGAVDMGTAFDCFDEASHTDNARVSAEAKSYRGLLVAAMAKAGFQNYAREWWHFSFVARGFDKVFDFPVD